MNIILSTARSLCLVAAVLYGCDGSHEADAGFPAADTSPPDGARSDAMIIDGGLDAATDEDGSRPPGDASAEDANDASVNDASFDAAVEDGSFDTVLFDASIMDAGPRCVDADGDGAGVGEGCSSVDCDDTDSSRYPGALEVCDLVDNDCDGEDDESCVCPLLSARCAAGCCALSTEQITSGEGNYPDATLDAEGNLYVAFADPDSLSWRSGLATRTVDSGAFRQVDYLGGSPRSEVRVDATGRVHHMHATSSGPVQYRYSDDRGQTWTELGPIPRTLRIGGACSLDVDAARRPHLYCGFDEPVGFRGDPTYVYWDGSTWRLQRMSTNAGGHTTTQMHLDSAGRPQVIHTYGPSSTPLHHTRYTGTSWLTEPVPIGAGLQVNGDRAVGFELDDADGLHVFFTARPVSGGDYTGYYAHRTSDGVWTFETAIPSSVIGGSPPQAYLALQADGEPVVATGAGAMARRSASGTWLSLSSPHLIQALVVDRTRALVIFRSVVGLRSLHIGQVNLFP